MAPDVVLWHSYTLNEMTDIGTFDLYQNLCVILQDNLIGNIIAKDFSI